MSKVFLVILGMGIVTAACRVVPFAIAGRLQLSEGFITWMKYVPVAILAAVIAPQVLNASADSIWGAIPLPLLATIPTVVTGVLCRNLFASVLVGVSALALLRAI